MKIEFTDNLYYLTIDNNHFTYKRKKNVIEKIKKTNNLTQEEATKSFTDNLISNRQISLQQVEELEKSTYKEVESLQQKIKELELIQQKLNQIKNQKNSIQSLLSKINNLETENSSIYNDITSNNNELDDDSTTSEESNYEINSLDTQPPTDINSPINKTSPVSIEEGFDTIEKTTPPLVKVPDEPSEIDSDEDEESEGDEETPPKENWVDLGEVCRKCKVSPDGDILTRVSYTYWSKEEKTLIRVPVDTKVGMVFPIYLGQTNQRDRFGYWCSNKNRKIYVYEIDEAYFDFFEEFTANFKENPYYCKYNYEHNIYIYPDRIKKYYQEGGKGIIKNPNNITRVHYPKKLSAIYVQ